MVQKLETLKTINQESKLIKPCDTPFTVKDETKKDLEKFYSEISLNSIGISIDYAKKLAESLGIKSEKDLEKYQKDHGIKVDKILGKETFLEMKAGVVLKNFKEYPEIKENQDSVLFIFENTKLKRANFPHNIIKLFFDVKKFQVLNKEDEKYKEFFTELDKMVFKKAEIIEKDLTKTNINGSSILGVGGLASLVKGDISGEQLWENNKDSIKSLGVFAAVFSLIFGVPKNSYKDIPGGANWYTRIPLLIGFISLGGLELVGVGIDKVTKSFDEGFSGDRSTPKKSAVSAISSVNGSTQIETRKKLNKINNNTTTANNELGVEKLDLTKKFVIENKLQKKILDIKDIKLDSNITISGLGLTEEFKNTGITNKDLSKYIKLLISTNPNTKTFSDIFVVENKKFSLEKEDNNITVESLIAYYEANPSNSILGNGPKNEARETLVENKKYKEFNEELLNKYNSPKLKLIITLSRIWIDSAIQAKQGISAFGLINDKDILQKGIDGVKLNLNEIFKILNDKDKKVKDIDTYIKYIFNEIYKVESNSKDIFDNVKDIQKLFIGLNKNNYNERLSKLIKFSSGSFIQSGNTEKSKEIAREIIIENYFKDTKDNINNLNDIHSLKASFFKGLGLTENESKETIEDIKKTYTEVYSETSEHREIIEENFKKQNPDFTGNTTIAVNNIISKTALIQSKKMAEIKLLDYKIDSIVVGNADEIPGAYRSINSTTHKTIEWLGDNGLMLALSLIPIGAGFAAAGIAAKGASWAMRGKTLVDYGNKVRFAGNSVKGVAFYEGMNLTNNLLYDNDLLTGAFDTKEIIKSALFFNIMGIANKWIKPGEKFISKSNASGIIKEIGAFTGVDLGVEFIYGEEISPEQFLNSLITGGMLTIISRGIKFKSKESGNGKPVNLKANLTKIKDIFKNIKFKEGFNKTTGLIQNIHNGAKKGNIGTWLGTKSPKLKAFYDNPYGKKVIFGLQTGSAVLITSEEIGDLYRGEGNRYDVATIVATFYSAYTFGLISSVVLDKVIDYGIDNYSE